MYYYKQDKEDAFKYTLQHRVVKIEYVKISAKQTKTERKNEKQNNTNITTNNNNQCSFRTINKQLT